MAADTWVGIYRTYSDDALAAEVATLIEQINNAAGITSQGSGTKNYTRDLPHLEGRLGAATKVQKERGLAIQRGPMSNHWGVPDFSCIRGL